MKRIKEKLTTIAEAIRNRNEFQGELKIEEFKDKILEIKNGLEVSNSIVNEEYYKLYNEDLYPGAMIKIAESCDVIAYEIPNSKLYSCCLSNKSNLQYAYTDIDDVIYLQLNNKIYILDKKALYYLQLVSIEEIGTMKYKLILNIDNQYAEIEIDNNNISIQLQDGIIVDNLIIKNEGIVCNNHLLVDVQKVFDENSYVTNDYDLYISGQKITKLPEGAIIKACVKQSEEEYNIYYLFNHILYKVVAAPELDYLFKIEVVNLDIDYERPYSIFTIVDNKVGVLYNDIADNCIHFNILDNEDYLLAKNIYNYKVMYRDEKNLIISTSNKILHFKLTSINKCATKVVKPKDKMNGLCICNAKAMIGNKVRILLPKEDK